MTVYVGPRGECQSSYLVHGEIAGNYFFGGNSVGDCGFFLGFPTAGTGQPAALKGKTFGFDGAAGPHLENIYEVVSQSGVTGSGTEASPYSQTTVFAVEAAATKYAEITEVTTYVNGAPQFQSTYTVKNLSGSNLYFRAMYAGDLYVNGNDQGIGIFQAGPPRFIGGQNTGSGIIGGFVEVTPWSAFQEAYWNDTSFFEEISAGDNGIWHDVETNLEGEPEKAFNETVEPKELDNGAGVEWDQYRTGEGLKPGVEASFTILNRTQIPNALQFAPANQTLTQGQTATVSVTANDTANQPYAGRALRYTVTGTNPQSGSVVLNAAGQAQISYVGNNPGADTIQMYVDLGGSGTQTTADPSGTATVNWLPKPPTPNSSYTIAGEKVNADGTITITFVPAQSGTATLEVTVPTASIAKKKKKCKKGQVLIKGKCRPASTVSGRVSAAGTAGVPLTLTLKPSSKVKKALKRGRTVKLTATLTYRSSLGGVPAVQFFHFTVKPHKHKKHH